VKILPVVDPLRILRFAEARDLKFCMHIEGCAKVRHMGHGGYVRVT